jgi:3-dehydroquinate dehydratase-1
MEAIASGCIDLIDIELFSDPDSITELTALAKEKGVKTIFSSHDFYSTPSCGELLSRLRHMEKLGADIAKIAVMPRCPEDVLTLLTATVTARRQLTCPVVTMAMAGTGLISRVWGEIFGSCLTFGLAGQASAPGQIDARELKCVLDILHNNL